MGLKRFGYAALLAFVSTAFVLGSAATGEAKAKKDMAGPPPYFCNWLYKPVCGVKDGVTNTYSSACWAAKDGAKILYEGACKVKKAKKAMKKPAMKKPAMKKSKKKM
jgi:hypothetical protein